MLAFFLLAACADCHKTQADHFAKSGMGHALTRATETHRGTVGPYDYRVEKGTLSAPGASTPLQWTFGAGPVGKTWLYQKDGRWYESRVSYYKALNGLDVTTGEQS